MAWPSTPWAARSADADYGRPASPAWREIDWREHLRETRVAGRVVRWVEIGSGDAPPAVFVHGLGGNWQSWLETLPRTARGRRALALDLPGFGGSEMPAEEISISGYARTIDAWLDAVGAGPVAVVGNSMGGFIAAELAIQVPDRVERLALVAAAGLSSTSLRRRPTRTAARLATVVGLLTAARERRVVARPNLRYLLLATVARHPSLLRADLAFEVSGGARKPGYMDALDALMSYDFRDRLGEVSCPTLIVWGDQDVLVPVRDASEFERLVPDSRRVVMEDTGHVPMLERPDAFNDLLVEFLSQAGGTAPPAQVVSAPSEAEPTWRAYLPSTPVR